MVASTSSLPIPAPTPSRTERGRSVDSERLDDEDLDLTRDTKKRKTNKGKAAVPAKKSVGKKKGKEKEKESAFVTTLPWPQHFLELEKVFKALNTLYTFVSARKSMATTFEMLRGGVEKIIKRPLEIHDLAQIKSLLPALITFAYIDEEMLRVHAAGGDEEKAKKEKEKDEIYQFASSDKGKETGAKESVLLFVFNDGELKSSNSVSGKVGGKFRKKPQKPADGGPVETAPKFTTESMTTLINKRNLKFTSAVSELLVACEVHEPPQDPVDLLLAATEDHLPVKPGGDDEKGLKERQGDLEYYRNNPDKRRTVAEVLEEIMEGEDYAGQIVENGHRVIDERVAVYGDLDNNLSQQLWDVLYHTKKLTRLYSHQAEAINLLDQGKNVIVSTSTSSGKSLIYQIPMLKALENDPASTGIYIFPTKALAQDQMRGLRDLLAGWEELEHVKIATFDGDTAREDRDYIRENANVIFTNPDMLHITVLPREETWRRFFQNLKFVVVDELHTYRGLFGCHVAFVMRRLRRICAAVGNRRVQFISCSATIQNPVEHMSTVFGVENVELEHIIWNPAFVDPHDTRQGRVSTLTEASRLFRFLIDRGMRVIVFCKVRMQCEILMKQVRADLLMEGRSDVASRIVAYRSGYSAADRRKIEQEMFSGQLLGVVATTALELGIDIGSLDAVISVGFPYHLPGLRQQAGRAGRRNKDSLAMLICDPFPLDQHYAAHPSEIFDSPFNALSLDLTNPIVLEAHVQCAADEMPVHPEEDVPYFGETLPTICESRLIGDTEGFYHTHPRCKPNPARLVPIRNTEDEKYDVVDITGGRNKILEEVEGSRAIFTVYDGAVYMHQGRTFLCKEVSHDTKVAKVEQASINWRTRQRDFTNVDPVEALAIREIEGSGSVASYGTVSIVSQVFGYFKTDHRGNILDTVDISSPPFSRSSHGFWIDVPKAALEVLLLKNLHPAGSIHGAEHALLSLTPIVSMCVEGDVRTECKQPEKELASTPSSRKRPARLILYDSAGKSGGICAKAFDHMSYLVRQAADTIANCACSEGCPSCIASSVCSGANTIVSKLGALVVLQSILGRLDDTFVDSIPVQPIMVGAVPGGSIDLAAAGIKTFPGKGVGPGGGFLAAGRRSALGRGEVETEEMGVDEEAEREAALAELMG
ncbi:DNA/RNA helicase, DEAD/DEAH box type [Pseudohyphozyma bogoriensis]|nr:DNA/RNA helicase, DEAD/DEAH box type [Pseudohyphozyma bogoriensis]